MLLILGHMWENKFHPVTILEHINTGLEHGDKTDGSEESEWLLSSDTTPFGWENNKKKQNPPQT